MRSPDGKIREVELTDVRFCFHPGIRKGFRVFFFFQLYRDIIDITDVSLSCTVDDDQLG